MPSVRCGSPGTRAAHRGQLPDAGLLRSRRDPGARLLSLVSGRCRSKPRDAGAATGPTGLSENCWTRSQDALWASSLNCLGALIATAVEDAYVLFEHSVIRDYIPLLVERRAHKQLTPLAANPDRSLQLTPTA